MCDIGHFNKQQEQGNKIDLDGDKSGSKRRCIPGKSTGITMKFCPELERGTWCQIVAQCHDEAACHKMSQKRRGVLACMKRLLDAHVNQPVCPEWDTSSTCENTPGPYRFGVNKGSNNDNYKIIGSKVTFSGCECIRRNGLQDDCPLPRCRGSPACKVTPFPQCEPFLNIPDAESGSHGQSVNDRCCCPLPYC